MGGGNERISQDMVRELKQRGANLDLPTRAGSEGGVADLMHDDWTGRLETAVKAGQIDLQKLGPLKSAREKVVLAAALKRTSGVSNGWLSETLKMGTPASVSHSRSDSCGTAERTIRGSGELCQRLRRDPLWTHAITNFN